MMKFILMPAYIITIAMIYFIMKSAIKPRRNILFGVTLPSEALSDEDVIKMVDEYKNKARICMSVIILGAVLAIFIKKEIIATVYLIIWSLISAEWMVRQPYIYINRKLTKLKKDREWFIGEKRIVSMDTKISRLKDKMPLPDKYMLIPILISLFALMISVVKYDEDLRYATYIAFVLMLIQIVLYFTGFRGSNKIKLKVYSQNSDINYALNKEEKYLNSIVWFITALTASIVYVFAYAVLYGIINIGYYFITIIAVLCSIITFVAFVYTNNKVRHLEEELLKMDKEIIYTDDDEYWIDGYKYYNENDKSSKVNPRFGFNCYTYNLATKKGKISYYSGIGIVAVLLIPLCFSLINMDITSPEISISYNGISVDYPYYDYEFKSSDIEEIKLVDSVSFNIRTNGIGTDKYCRGSFRSSEYGSCRVYIYNESNPYIIVKLKNNHFIYNEKTKEETMKIYNELKGLNI